jgi:hypothetical protein
MFFDCAAQRFETIRERERERERRERKRKASGTGSGGVTGATKTTLALGVCIRGGYALHFFDQLCSAAAREVWGCAHCTSAERGALAKSVYIGVCQQPCSACRPASESACKMRAAPQSKKHIRK